MPAPLAELAAAAEAVEAPAASSSTDTPPPAEVAVAEADTDEAETPEAGETVEGGEKPGDDPAAEPTGDEDERSVREQFRDYYSDTDLPVDWIDKYGTDEAFLKGIGQAQRLLRQRDENSRIVKYLTDNGVSIDDIQSLVQQKSRGTRDDGRDKDQNGKPGADDWDPSWVTVNQNGEWVPTAAAPPDIETRASRYRARVSAAMADPAKLAAIIKPHLGNELATETEAIRKEVEARIAAESNQRALDNWIAQHKASLYVGDKVGPEHYSQVGARVSELFNDEGFYPTAAADNRAQLALDWANAQYGQKPQPKKTVPPLAKRQPPPAAPPKQKLSPKEFRQKYGTRLADWVAYMDEGKLPEPITEA